MYPTSLTTESGHDFTVRVSWQEEFVSVIEFQFSEVVLKDLKFRLVENNSHNEPNRSGDFDLYRYDDKSFDFIQIEAYLTWGLLTSYLTLLPESNNQVKKYLMGECRLRSKCCPQWPYENRLKVRGSENKVRLDYIETEHKNYWSYQNSLTVAN